MDFKKEEIEKLELMKQVFKVQSRHQVAVLGRQLIKHGRLTMTSESCT